MAWSKEKRDLYTMLCADIDGFSEIQMPVADPMLDWIFEDRHHTAKKALSPSLDLGGLDSLLERLESFSEKVRLQTATSEEVRQLQKELEKELEGARARLKLAEVRRRMDGEEGPK